MALNTHKLKVWAKLTGISLVVFLTYAFASVNSAALAVI